MAKLSKEQKRLIVERLACWTMPADVVREINDTYGIKVSLPQLARYDPTGVNGQTLSPSLKELFNGVRKRFIENEVEIAVAHRSYRLQQLQRLIERTQSPKLKAELLEQAAKEVGGMFTNKRELSGPGGGPIAITEVEVRKTVLDSDDSEPGRD